MSLITIIYLGDVVENLSTVSFLFAIAITVFVFIMTMAYMDGAKEIGPKHVLIGMTISLFLWMSYSFLPTKQTLYTIAAVRYGEQVLTTPEAKEIGGKVYNILNQKLDEILKDDKK